MKWVWRTNLHANACQYLKTTEHFLSEDLCKNEYLLFPFTDTVFCLRPFSKLKHEQKWGVLSSVSVSYPLWDTTALLRWTAMKRVFCVINLLSCQVHNTLCKIVVQGPLMFTLHITTYFSEVFITQAWKICSGVKVGMKVSPARSTAFCFFFVFLT